jgi:hypothetical protein
MNTNAVCVAVAAKASGVAGIRGSSPRPPDKIPSSPWAVVGSHQAASTGGNLGMRNIHYTFPIHVYVERTADADRTSAVVNDLVDAFVVAFEAGITLGGTVARAAIDGWNTDLYAEVAEASYQVIDFTLSVVVQEASAYTP